MIRLLLIFLITSFSSIANAQSDNGKYAVCKVLSNNTSAQNVVYQAGVDVNGNPVVPADLNVPPVADTLNIVKIPLEFNLAQRINGLNLDGQLGMMEIHQDGKIMYGEQDISKPVMALCGQSFKEVTVNEIMVPKEQDFSNVPPNPTVPDDVQKLKQEIEGLKSELAIKEAAESMELPEVSPPAEAQAEVRVQGDVVMPAVKAPSIEMLDEVTPTKERMANMDRPKVSPPADPKKPLIGIPRATPKEPDVIKGQDYRDYNE